MSRIASMPITRSARRCGQTHRAILKPDQQCDIVLEGSAVVVWVSSMQLRRKAHEVGSRYEIASWMPNWTTYIVGRPDVIKWHCVASDASADPAVDDE